MQKVLSNWQNGYVGKERKMKIKIWFDKSNVPIEHEAKAMYQKGDMLCVEVEGGRIKYPLAHIFCTHEGVCENSSQRVGD